MNYVIIGNGVAGVNAAMAVRERDKKASLYIVSAETDYYYSRTALMYIAMGTSRLEDTEPLERRWYARQRIRLVRAAAVRADTQRRVVYLDGDRELNYDRLLLAVGAKPAFFGWAGMDLDGVVAMVSYSDLQNIARRLRTNASRAVVVGGGLIGIELCEVFRHHGLEVDFLLREDRFWPKALSGREARWVESHMRHHGVRIHYHTELAHASGKDGILTEITTRTGETFPCDILGIATGVRPELTLAAASGIPTDRGILCDWSLRTPREHVYTAGDCAQIIDPDTNASLQRTIWYSARDMGRVAGYNMAGGSERYDPGPWYNSAKFFELEYTTAGDLDSEGTDVYWEDRACLVRARHNGERVLGFNTIGRRWDHAVLLRFIAEGRDIGYVSHHLEAARFEAELSYPFRLHLAEEGRA